MNELPTLTAADLHELDAVIRDRGVMAALQHVMQRFRIGLSEAQILVVPRDRAIHPEPTLEQQEEAARLKFRSLPPGRAVAVRAEWDGDSAGWFVVLDVLFGDPDKVVPVCLATFRGPGGDFRLFAGQVPPWPESELAERVGSEFAQALGVSFTFVNRDGPAGTGSAT